jgi:hypothetical protein
VLPSSPVSWADTALFQGHHYSPFGPFPAILSMPLIWAGYFHQGTLSFVASLAVFYLSFRLASNFNYSRNKAGCFGLAFCFATSFIGVAALACSAFFAHVTAVMLLFLAINEYEGRRRLADRQFYRACNGDPNADRVKHLVLYGRLIRRSGDDSTKSSRPCEITAPVCGLCRTIGSLQFRALRNSSGIGLHLSAEWFRYAIWVMECSRKHGGTGA